MKKQTEENSQKESSASDVENLDEQRISFSADLISFLEEKKKGFNKKNKSSIKIEQLKQIYLRGASSTDKDLNLHGLARVNMFFRMREQKIMGVDPAKSDNKAKLSGLILESEADTKLNSFIDISESWMPQEEDIKEAKANIEKYNLDFNFKNIEELYLEPYKPIQLDWE
jgi:hypothetical protein